MLYYMLTALNSPYIGKYEPKQSLSKLPTDECDTSKPPEACQKNMWVETMLKNNPVINVRPVSVGIYDLLTSRVAYFPHLLQLLSPGLAGVAITHITMQLALLYNLG